MKTIPNPTCRCGHPRSAHDFNRVYEHKRCTHQSEKDGVCSCGAFRFEDNRG